MNNVILKPNRDFSTTKHHPWIFSGAIEKVEGNPQAGDTVRVLNASGEAIAVAAYSPQSQIRLRIWSFDPAEIIDADFFERRVATAIAARAQIAAEASTDAFRLINAENDALPGVVADRYGDFVVCQFSAAGAAKNKLLIANAIAKLCNCRGVYEKTDGDLLAYEGLKPTSGALIGEEPSAKIVITENGVRYNLEPREGHKTGFYLDQRENRAIVAKYAQGAEMLNVFSYTGGFGLAAANAGAKKITHVELSERAIELAKENAALNAAPAEKHEYIRGNAFEELRKMRDRGQTFDLIVLDPPKFADSKNALRKALRGYKDINLLAMKLLREGGILATFSCSGLVSPEIFRTVVTEAAADSSRDFQILRELRAGADHPVRLAFPEGLYLKGLLLRF